MFQKVPNPDKSLDNKYTAFHDFDNSIYRKDESEILTL